MKTVLVLFFILNSLLTSAQNLVVNGDFELYDSCPSNYSDPFDIQINRCTNWTAPTYGTSDYFNSCAPNISVSTPYNGLGYQPCLSGNAYCGLIPMTIQNNINLWSEYIQGEVMPLEKDKIYKLSINVNLSNYSIYSFEELGVWLSDYAFTDYSTPKPINSISPQFLTPKGYFINDTINWMHFEWYFIANGTENHIIIGKFNDTSVNDLMTFNGNGTIESYIFLDDISIVAENQLFVDVSNVFSPNNDGINDYWSFPYKSAGITEIAITNRWGGIIRKEELSNFTWDGTDRNGNKCSEGVYFYTIKSSLFNFSGFIHLEE